ncbi:Mov34/MPN/PAD-1 family protein [candidate division CSSED10-310 bacterium]|uniref:Mov34/MPN/PAD-1 family protein n=1 Tax=candidate division CSSED10-310 bacterium TaxID=2855610 RepID=A0ABV6YSV7_UNCC1
MNSPYEKKQLPDFTQINEADAKKRDFPLYIAAEYRVYFEESAYNRMKTHAATSSEIELCGVLLGNIFHDERGFFLIIEAVIEGEGAQNYGSQVTFTHETWNHINDVKDRLYKNLKIVGWYHTHPGFGVFLSSMDSFIQENFFNEPFQIAVVIETVKQNEGCFAWVNGESIPLRRYWVGQKEVKLVAGEVEKFELQSLSSAVKDHSHQDGASGNHMKFNLSWPYLLLLLFIFLVGFFGGNVSGNKAILKIVNDIVISELYSHLKFAFSNLAASRDFGFIREQLASIKENVPHKSDLDTAKELNNLMILVATFENDYSKMNSTLQRTMKTFQNREQSLVNRVISAETSQAKMVDYLSDLYLMRVGDIVNSAGGIQNISKLHPNQQETLKMFLMRIFDMAPPNKLRVQKEFPGLIEHLFSHPSQTSNNENDKAVATKEKKGLFNW